MVLPSYVAVFDMRCVRERAAGLVQARGTRRSLQAPSSAKSALELRKSRQSVSRWALVSAVITAIGLPNDGFSPCRFGLKSFFRRPSPQSNSNESHDLRTHKNARGTLLPLSLSFPSPSPLFFLLLPPLFLLLFPLSSSSSSFSFLPRLTPSKNRQILH